MITDAADAWCRLPSPMQILDAPPTMPPDAPEPDAEAILGRLNAEQRAAAEAVRGPVAILAGAGTGKTTTVTHRIAWQVASGSFAPRDLLAVTFTDKAAGELRSRLAALGVHGVEARTFHGAARWMLGVLWETYAGSPIPALMPHKISLLEELVRGLPAPDCFRPRREIAQEIEWAKNRRVTPARYLEELERSRHEQPLRDAELMQRIFARYEQAKERAGAWDFEDLLSRLADLLDEHPAAAERLRARFQALTVDEYQDVNPLQQALLDHWVGDRADVCVVGDDYQTIYAFTGATPAWLLEFPSRYPDATVVRLEESWRSTAPVLELANRLTPKLGGFDKQLRPAPPLARAHGAPRPVALGHATRAEEAAWVAAECRRLHEVEGVGWQEMAILYRINARSPEFEAALHHANVPFVVTSGAFLDRPGPRGLLRMLERRRDELGAAVVVQQGAERLGWRPDGAVKGGDDAQTLQEDLALLVATAAAQDWPSIGAFADHVRDRFGVRADERGVELLTLHRAKGLEWETVFLPRLNEKELPFRSRTSAADVDDERRLLYVGLTRAKRRLYLTRAADAGRPSMFLAELGLDAAEPSHAQLPRRSGAKVKLDEGDPVVSALRAWRAEECARIGKPAYVVFDNKTLVAIAAARPESLADLAAVSGVGPARLERHGEDVLDIVRGALQG